ncbi:MAG: hypothetical protein CLLPBCKN_006452 [Chroococcidiopsis cubana SAG 39.79]|uniref:Uncharacterized protein n=1 Tax=Chroococcidiopsis cubana SAG 39.79 TaxID=388085 RepID=A0AB37UGN5_9CYAN|nr:hypothetical protein [Chroococcidiopsis cubana SAG 39.79]PSB57462.1 hypothetical protein C7B79_30935 [Chroococcidiopsis cubana CCALA 043]RUT10760.1 hypothetical protein DSM107010_40000 [Chroococcidiopsis cubana SAG 39.79]
MVIPLENYGMAPKRNRIVRSFSLRADNQALFARARERVKAHVPGANDSELIRLGLELLVLCPEALVGRVAGLLERVESGRPPVHTPPVSAWEGEKLLEEDEGERRRRLALFEELERLREGPRGAPEVEARVEALCRYFGMVYSAN